MFQRFFPDAREVSAYQIDFDKWYEKGYRGVIFDIDNTLVEHGKDATKEARELFKHLSLLGFQSCLLSNNKEERVVRFNRDIKTNYIFKAGKPAGKNYKKAMELMGTKPETTLFVGDQLFTDVWGAKRLGIYNILVNPIDKKEEIQIVLKRYLERLVLYFYEREAKGEK
jgi:hypothetical protein